MDPVLKDCEENESLLLSLAGKDWTIRGEYIHNGGGGLLVGLRGLKRPVEPTLTAEPLDLRNLWGRGGQVKPRGDKVPARWGLEAHHPPWVLKFGTAQSDESTRSDILSSCLKNTLISFPGTYKKNKEKLQSIKKFQIERIFFKKIISYLL